jgi:predicted membrane protein (TIGR00267 family)
MAQPNCADHPQTMPLRSFHHLLRISRARGIMRRYFVVNGFDGVLTMLGIVTGFRIGGSADSTLVASACLGAAIALGISGLTSAYISESAEQRRALRELERAMLADLADTRHELAARLIPIATAAVNGLSPLVLSLLVITPFWADALGLRLPLSPFDLAVVIDLAIVFMLGVYLGRISGRFWLVSGSKALAVAVVTAIVIYLVSG